MSAKRENEVQLTIDGQEICVPKGTTILAAAKTAGIEIPHFCYHPHIGSDGNCRICLVEVVGAPKLVISCATEAMGGSQVLTDSEKVKKARQGVLEFILLNHPLDCPFCDKGGECPLQNYTFKHRLGHSRFEFTKRHGVKHEVIGEHIMFDSERCILCSRCVRYMRDIVGREELLIEERGAACQVRLFPGKQLSTGFSGNLADICPVGALTSRDFRFQARPWEMTARHSSCGICALQCSSQHWSKGGRYLRQTPRIDSQVNGPWLCDAGRYAHLRLINKDRLKRPLIKDGSSLSQLGFGAGYRHFAKLAEAADRIYLAPTCWLTNEELTVMYSAAKAADKLRVLLPSGFSALAKKYQTLQEKELLPLSMEQVLACSEILLLGEDPTVDHPVLHLLLRKYSQDKRGTIRLVTEKPSELDSLANATRATAEKISAKKMIDDIDSGADLAIVLHERFANDKVFNELLGAIAKRKGKTYLAIGLEGVNKAGWFSLEQSFPGVSVEAAKLSAFGPQDLIYAPYVQAPAQGVLNGTGRLVLESYFQDEYSARASLVFPKESPLEKTGTYVNLLGKVQKINRGVAIIEPTHLGFRHLLQLMQLAGSPVDFGGLEEIYRAGIGQLTGYPADYRSLVDQSELYEHYVTRDEKSKSAQTKAADCG